MFPPAFVRAAAAVLLTATLVAAQWTPKSPASSPSARFGAAMTFHAGLGQVLLFGGGTPLINGETWVYDGSGWTQLAPGSSPTARFGAQMVYDPVRAVAVLYGGLAANTSTPPPNSDTWEFDGVTWAQAAPAANAGPRYQYGACFDTLRSRMVLFGGNMSQLAGSPNSQTWEYSGATWTLVTTVGNPGPRNRPAMCFHPVLGKAVLFGGSDSSGLTDETWLYDGAAATWTQVAIAGARPAVRSAAAMVYDPVRNLCVLHGGQNSGGPLADTWTFDGTTWTAQPLQVETVRDHAMAFLPASRTTVKFGGVEANPNFLSNQTREFGAGALGVGCPGSNGVPVLSQTTGLVLGQSYTLQVTNMNPSFSAAALVFGFTQLPGVDLGPLLGMPGCFAFTTLDASTGIVGAGGSAVFVWPAVAGAVGDNWYTQAACFDPGVNGFDLTVSNAVFATIGT
ncbi:MAG: hypothetical protein JNM25_16925 [Planctomycetes bacterium]|nr:hypothetical protein [Planctomycetota bacterium]